MRAIRRVWRRLELGWRAGLRRLPFFTHPPSVTTTTTTIAPGVLDPVQELLGPVVSTLVP